MKREQDLIREILLAVEANDKNPLDWIELKIANYTKRQISYHVHLLDEAGYLEAIDVSTMGEDGYCWYPKRLTFHGHEFLETVRQPEVWAKTKEIAKNGGSMAIEVLLEIGKAVITANVKAQLMKMGISS
jgi:hypothetical protein